MDHQTQGIVLRLHPFSETSLIVRWLTPGLGRIATLARGALRPKSPLRGRLDLCYLAQLTLVHSRRSTLHTLKEVALRETFPLLRHNYTALRQAAYGVQLIERATEPDTPLPGLFELLRDFLQTLAQHGPDTLRILALELRLLAWSGQAPATPPASFGSGERALFEQLLHAPWSMLPRLRAGPREFDPIERLLRDLLTEHWSLPPRVRDPVLRDTTIRSDPSSPPSTRDTSQIPPPPPRPSATPESPGPVPHPPGH
jgi:DNA repair protein RecO (recombination protein O)